jgi:hypothetical protein
MTPFDWHSERITRETSEIYPNRLESTVSARLLVCSIPPASKKQLKQWGRRFQSNSATVLLNGATRVLVVTAEKLTVGQ